MQNPSRTDQQNPLHVRECKVFSPQAVIYEDNRISYIFIEIRNLETRTSRKTESTHIMKKEILLQSRAPVLSMSSDRNIYRPHHSAGRHEFYRQPTLNETIIQTSFPMLSKFYLPHDQMPKTRPLISYLPTSIQGSLFPLPHHSLPQLSSSSFPNLTSPADNHSRPEY